MPFLASSAAMLSSISISAMLPPLRHVLDGVLGVLLQLRHMRSAGTHVRLGQVDSLDLVAVLRDAGGQRPEHILSHWCSPLLLCGGGKFGATGRGGSGRSASTTALKRRDDCGH